MYTVQLYRSRLERARWGLCALYSCTGAGWRELGEDYVHCTDVQEKTGESLVRTMYTISCTGAGWRELGEYYVHCTAVEEQTGLERARWVLCTLFSCTGADWRELGEDYVHYQLYGSRLDRARWGHCTLYTAVQVQTGESWGLFTLYRYTGADWR